MQAYRQEYCDDGSQQQMYRASSQEQMYRSSQQGCQGGMQMQRHHSGGAAMQHMRQGGGMQLGGGMNMMQKTSSMQSSFSSSQSINVFGQDAFCEIMPSSFPPGTDPKIIECYNRIDRDGNGIIDDRELQSMLGNFSHNFGIRTVHLLMYEFTHSNKRRIGPKEFVPLLKCLQTYRAMFQRYDRDGSGCIDSLELGQALNGLGYRVSPVIINMLVTKFSKSASGRFSLQYDSFIECCLTVKGLTETFNAKADCGRATFCYEEFLLNVLPFIIA